MSGIDLRLCVRVKNDHFGSECGGMFLYKMALLCDVLTGMLYGPGPWCRSGPGGCPNIGAMAGSTSGQSPADPKLYIHNLAQTRKHGALVTNLSLVLSSRRNLDHCCVYVLSVGVGDMMEDDIWTTGHV